jgi:O-antigen/teichoic acid export membrane protein
MNDYFKTGHLRTDLKQRAVRGAGFTVLSQALTFVVHIGSTMVLARLLTPDDFGLVAMVVTFSLLLQNFGLNGFTEAIMQKEELDQATVDTLFWINVAISLGLTLLFMASSSLLSRLYREPRLQAVAVAVALSIIFSGLANIHMALLKRSMQFKITSVIFFTARMAGFAVTIVLAWMGWGYWALVINVVAQPFVNAVCAWVFCGWRPGMPVRGTSVRSMVVYALNVYGNFSLNYGSRNVDNLLVGRSFGSLALGYYKKAYDIFALPVNQLTAPLTDVALATLSRLTGEPVRYRRYYLDAVSILAFIGMAMSLVMTVGAHDLVLLILGPQWSRSADLLLFFGPGVGIMLVYYTNGWLHLSLGRAERLFRWGFIELFVTVSAFLVGLRFGPAGVAAAWTVSFYLLTGIGLWYAGKPIQITLRSVWAEVWRYLAAAAGAGAASVLFLRFSGAPAASIAGLPILLRIALTCSICLALYLVFVIALYRGTRPVSQILSLVRDLAPRRSSRQQASSEEEKQEGDQVQVEM